MARWTVPLTGIANIAVTVETNATDPEIIAQLAQEAVNASLCHHCAGSGNNSLDLGDEWEPVRIDGAPEMTRDDA